MPGQYYRAMADDATDFPRSAPGVESADLRGETGAVQVYTARLVDGPENVRLITTVSDAAPQDQTAVRDRLDTWEALDTHHGISTVYEQGDEPRPWLAATTAGTPLSEAAPLSVEQTRAVLSDLAEALRHAAAGHTPGTIAPANVRVTEDGATLDWPTGATDSDPVVQLGRLAYYAVTAQSSDGGIESLADSAPPEFVSVVETALATDPEDRYDSPYAFKRALLFESHESPKPPSDDSDSTGAPLNGEPLTDAGNEGGPRVGRRALLAGVGVGAAAVASGAWATTAYLGASGGGAFPQFRFDAANTGYAAQNAGPTDGVTEAWSVNLGERIQSSPVVADQAVLISDGRELSYALSTQDGSERWRTSLSAFGAITATVDGGSVYFADNARGESAAITAQSLSEGTERWRDNTIDTSVRTPTVHDDRLYVFGNQGVHALDTGGELRWETDTVSMTGLAGAAAGETLYASVLTRSSPETGWEERTTGIVALDATDGSTRWLFESDATVNSSPAIDGDSVYAGNANGELLAVDSQEGEQRWRFEADEPIISSPAVTDHAGGTVYVGCNDGYVYAVDSEQGEQRWEYDTGGVVVSSPAVASDTVYVGSTNGTVYALDATEGTVRWRFETGDEVVSSPAVVSNRVFVGSNDGNLYALTEP
ncbi:outer membrane protein assembly factor BamB family protein [Halovenus salina]|uniref:outer membrane protein assembly factor BamB family protein n=1 Tax=Halovenus salina TaxID=1510225 RepID=UPI0022608214|nr:PQQ-binding-like beta-propeller repeat protein [Halovenus salina]